MFRKITRVSRDSRAALGRQLLSFALVGGVGFVVDVVIFNTLRTTVLDPHLVHSGPIIAKVISTSVAIGVNWIGNRLWTFRAERRLDVIREGIEFAGVSIIGAGIALACLWISHYLLGFTSILEDNIATNVIGLGLGTAFRFALYRWWVYSARRRPVGLGAGAGAGAAGAGAGAGAAGAGAGAGAGAAAARGA